MVGKSGIHALLRVSAGQSLDPYVRFEFSIKREQAKYDLSYISVEPNIIYSICSRPLDSVNAALTFDRPVVEFLWFSQN